MKQKIVIITNVPAHYRVKQFDLINHLFNNDLFVIYTKNNFSLTSLNWQIPKFTHSHLFLDESSDSKLHSISKIIKLIKLLDQINPIIIITAGFNFFSLIAFIYTKFYKIKNIVFTDSWIHPVSKLSIFHRTIRKIIIKRSNGFICVGVKGKEYLIKYGANPNKIFISRLTDDYSSNQKAMTLKYYDLLFSGQIIERKLPIFFVEVVNEVSKFYSPLRVLVVGTGPLENEMIEQLRASKVEFCFAGYIEPKLLNSYYASAKILLFPTLSDPWGMVANDALSFGMPVITTPFAGCADDLVVNGFNGFVLTLDKYLWKDKVLSLLENGSTYNKFSINALTSIQDYSVQKSADDFVSAVYQIINN